MALKRKFFEVSFVTFLEYLSLRSSKTKSKRTWFALAVKINKMDLIESKLRVTDHRKIELGTSYTTREILPKSLEGTSQKTNGVLPKSLEGTSCGNTINTIINSLDIVPVLPQFTSTEKSLHINELEVKIINSCSRGEKLLTQAKKNDIDNYWLYGSNNHEIESLRQLVKEYQNALNNI